MKVEWTDSTPRKIQQYAGADYPRENPDLEDLLTSEQVDHIAEIFQTPLTGSYNWDYAVQDDRIKKLYDLGKQLNWDPEMDIDWDRPWDTVLDQTGPNRYRWFSGGEVNTCYNAVDFHIENGRGDQNAIIYDSPVTQTIKKYT